MLSKYKLLFLDVDGTVVSSKENALPSKRVIKSVKLAQKHVHVALATGRSLEHAKLIIDSLGLDGLSVFTGGAEIINVTTGEVILRRVVSESSLREIVKLALPFGYNIFTEADQYQKLVISPKDITSPAAQLLIEAVATMDCITLVEELNTVKGTVAHRTSSWVDGDVEDIHVSNVSGTKRHSAEKLISLLGFKKEEVIAIGDGYNDVPLLESAGVKVAMGNAPDEVKAVADYVTASLDDDGVAEAIEQLILA